MPPQTIYVAVEGMSCMANCGKTVENALNSVAGVTAAKVQILSLLFSSLLPLLSSYTHTLLAQSLWLSILFAYNLFSSRIHLPYSRNHSYCPFSSLQPFSSFSSNLLSSYLFKVNFEKRVAVIQTSHVTKTSLDAMLSAISDVGFEGNIASAEVVASMVNSPPQTIANKVN